jgi:hypothetical protein
MKKLIAITLLLIATSANALTFTRTEDRIDDITVMVLDESPDPAFLVSFRTYDSSGLIREISNRNLWSLMSSDQKTNLRNMLTTVRGALYVQESIPTPTPSPVPTPTP